MRGLIQMVKGVINSARPTYFQSLKAIPSIHQTWANLEATNLLSKSLPLPSISALAIFNLRDLLEKTLGQSDTELTALATALSGSNLCSRIINLSRLSISGIKGQSYSL